MKHKKNVFSWCRGRFRGRWANLTEAQADHHPRVPAQLPPLRARCVLGWTMPPAPQFPPPRTRSCLCSQWSRGLWGICLMSPWTLLSLPTYAFCKAIHSMIPVTTLQPPLSRTLAGRLAGGSWLGEPGERGGQQREDNNAPADWLVIRNNLQVSMDVSFCAPQLKRYGPLIEPKE